MIKLVRCLIASMFLLVPLAPARAAFTSLYVFGDGVCTTTNSPGGTAFYGNRYSNGRVWIEVLAQRQGLTYDSNRNWSYFGHDSAALTNHVAQFTSPPDVASSLFVIWANDADFVFFIQQFDANASKLAEWTNAMSRSLTNHLRAIQTLHGKGVRTLVLPNVVDLMQVPFYVQSPAAEKSFIRSRITEYNAAFTVALNQARASLPGLVVFAPDVHSLLNDILARPTVYSVTNAQFQGYNIDALSDPNLPDKSLNGPGRDYVFWEYLDPTAKVHEILADFVQSLISPSRIAPVGSCGSVCPLSLANLPLGLDGFVDASTNFLDWTAVAGFSCTNTTQSVVVPAAPINLIYRLRFPFAWSWP